MVALLGGAPLASHAAGTPAGTNIQNTAQVSYTVGGSAVTTSSNTSSVRVAEILDAVLTLAAPTVTVSPGATAEELVYTLTNTGNGSEIFNLTALSAGVIGDDFDPTLASPAIYFDTDNSGDFSAGDVAYSAGVNNPVLAADASVRLIVVNNIPDTVLNGNRGRSQLTAAAATGTGAPGTRVRRCWRWWRRCSRGHDRRRRTAVRRIPRRGRAAHCREVADRSSISSAARVRCRARASTTRSSSLRAAPAMPTPPRSATSFPRTRLTSPARCD